MSASRKKFLKAIVGTLGLGLFSSHKSSAEEKTETTAQPFVGEPLIGTIAIFPYRFVPRNWLACNGQLLNTNEYQTLFSLLGYTFGGSGTNFALPDLRDRFPIGAGTTYSRGATGGSATHTLSANQMPAHNHDLNVSSAPGTSHEASGKVLAANRDGILHYGATADATLAAGAVSTEGSGAAINHMPPYLSLQFCIAAAGVYPSQS